jgi:ABC-2 type transport system ATP-binding protein
MAAKASRRRFGQVTKMRSGRWQARFTVPLGHPSGRGGQLVAASPGLLGPNGAGKTTLLRTFATVAAPKEGRLRILGRDPDQTADRLAIRRSLGYLPQDAGFPRGFTAFEAIDYLAILKEHTVTAARHEEVRRVLRLVGLHDVATKKVRALSGGMRRRLALAQSLLGRPELLVLDEPTVGLDPEQRIRFREIISEAGVGRTVVLSTHQTEDVAALCSQVVVIDRGRALFAGSVPDLASSHSTKLRVGDSTNDSTARSTIAPTSSGLP